MKRITIEQLLTDYRRMFTEGFRTGIEALDSVMNWTLSFQVCNGVLYVWCEEPEENPKGVKK
ncbi:MAG: hypothetical protein J6P40_07425 [Oscillospiraceae bacterium]|nr:hypothetical protein [Oscillospiraceae bacterium]